MSSPRRHRFAPIMLLGLLGACAPSETSERIGRSDQPVYLGEPALGDPAVVALTNELGLSYCSGTLITPSVVLTAAHCLPPHAGKDYTAIRVFFGSSTKEEGTSVKVVDGWTHPSWFDDAIYYDVGLIRLAEPGPTEPLPWYQGGEDLVDGAAVRIVGFGITGEGQGGSGLKREGTATIANLDAHILELYGNPSGTCSGDSGGATIMSIEGQDVLVGVHSRADCWGTSIEMRTDQYVGQIESFIGDPACEANGQCALDCPYVDPDCPCADDGFCTDLCEDSQSDPDCPETCVADDFCDPTCESDPDCACGADDYCDVSCASDPDCGCAEDGHCASGCSSPDPDCASVQTPCSADGQCDASCAVDPDCGDEVPPLANQADGGGCAMGEGRQPLEVELVWLLALGLVLARRRR